MFLIYIIKCVLQLWHTSYAVGMTSVVLAKYIINFFKTVPSEQASNSLHMSNS